MRTWLNTQENPAPEAWLESTEAQPGSWWPTWEHWLAQHSTPGLLAPPSMGRAEARYVPLEDAPGQYVLQK